MRSVDDGMRHVGDNCPECNIERERALRAEASVEEWKEQVRELENRVRDLESTLKRKEHEAEAASIRGWW